MVAVHHPCWGLPDSFVANQTSWKSEIHDSFCPVSLFEALDPRSWDTASRSACDAFEQRCHTTLGDSSIEEDEVSKKENWKEAAERVCGAGGASGLTKDVFDGFR